MQKGLKRRRFLLDYVVTLVVLLIVPGCFVYLELSIARLILPAQ